MAQRPWPSSITRPSPSLWTGEREAGPERRGDWRFAPCAPAGGCIHNGSQLLAWLQRQRKLWVGASFCALISDAERCPNTCRRIWKRTALVGLAPGRGGSAAPMHFATRASAPPFTRKLVQTGSTGPKNFVTKSQLMPPALPPPDGRKDAIILAFSLPGRRRSNAEKAQKKVLRLHCPSWKVDETSLPMAVAAHTENLLATVMACRAMVLPTAAVVDDARMGSRRWCGRPFSTTAWQFHSIGCC